MFILGCYPEPVEENSERSNKVAFDNDWPFIYQTLMLWSGSIQLAILNASSRLYKIALH